MTLIIETSSDKGLLEALKEKYESEPYSKLFMPLAEQLRMRGCYGEAIELCTRAKALHPHYVSCRVLLGRCFVELGLKEEASRELEEVLEMDRENVFSLRVMAEILRAQGRLTEAADYYRALVRINPTDMDAQERLAVLVKLVESSEDGERRPLEPFQDTSFHYPEGAPAERIELDASEPGAGREAFSRGESRHEQQSNVYEGEREVLTAQQVSHSESNDPPLPQEELAARASQSGPSVTAPLGKKKASPRSSIQFFKHEIRQSDFSTFAQWVSKLRQEQNRDREPDGEQECKRARESKEEQE